MFNRTVVVAPSREAPVYVEKTIHEHRAPTDKSVELLRDMEAKAEAEVVKSVAVSDNGFECVIHQIKDFMSAQHRYRVVWTLNGRRCTTEFAALMHADTALVIRALRDRIAQDIANIALESLSHVEFN